MYGHDDDGNEEEKDWREEFQQKLAVAIGPAIDALVRCARGEWMENDQQLRACIALTRLAPMLVTEFEQSKPPLRWLAHPDNSPEEVERLLDSLEGKVPDESSEMCSTGFQPVPAA